jgi:putative endonuclease
LIVTGDFYFYFLFLNMSHHIDTGRLGETLGAGYLQQNGFMIIHLNWRYSRYEIDIIATKNNILHFIEVKTRKTTTYGFPEESVSKKKISFLLKGGAGFLRKFPQWKRVQYDVLSITLSNDKSPEYFFIEDIYL